MVNKGRWWPKKKIIMVVWLHWKDLKGRARDFQMNHRIGAIEIGTYVLQSVCAKFNQYSVDPTCVLCGENPEDHGHFLLRCRSLTESRDPFIKTIKSVLSQYLGDEVQQCICRDSEVLVALILDCTAVELNLRETQREDFLSKFKSVARGLCCALHCERTRLLNELK